MNVHDNLFLKLGRGVRLTPHIIPVILGLDPYFEDARLSATVTSGQRTSEDQLSTIRNYCVRYNLDDEFPEIHTCLATEKANGQYVWQMAWSKLLNIGVIINPPYPAMVLMDYWRNGENKIGIVIGHSPHYYGLAFDIGGSIDHDISNELVIVRKAFTEKKIPGFKGYLPERKNNCIHIDCNEVKIQKP